MSDGRYQPYPEYQVHGEDWLSAVPSHWRTKRLKHITSHNDEVLDEATRPDTEILYVDISSVDSSSGIQAKEQLQFANAPSRARRCVQHGDVIVSTVRTYLRAIARIRHPEKNLIVSTGFAVVRPREELMPDFLGYLLSASFFVEEVIARSTGVSYPAINASDLVGIPAPVPPLPEQTQIAKFLDHETAKIDRLIEKQEALIRLLKEKRQAVISHAVTKGLNPHAPLKDSGIEWLGQVPAHWTVTTLKYLVAIPIIDGPHESPIRCDDGIPFVSAEALSGGTVDFDKKWGYISPREHQRFSQRFSPLRGDIFMVKLGATTGAVGIVETDEVFNIWVPLAAIRLIQSIEPRFIFHFLKSESAQDAVRLSWTYGTQQTLGLKTLSNFRIPVPPKEERVRIIDYIDSKIPLFDNSIEKATASIALMQERRTALISAAVTGKIDVRHWQPPVESESN